MQLYSSIQISDLVFIVIKRKFTVQRERSQVPTVVNIEILAGRVRVGARTVEVSEPSWTYGAAEQAADGATGALRFEVSQVGALAVSAAAEIGIAGG